MELPQHWDNKNLNLNDSLVYNKNRFKKIYKKHRKLFSQRKKTYKEFEKFSNYHINMFSVMGRNMNSIIFDNLKELEKLIYSNIFLIKLKYNLIIQNNLYSIIGNIILSSYIMNTFFQKQIDNNTMLSTIFNNISLDNPDYISYLNQYKIYILCNIDTVIIENDNMIKLSLIKMNLGITNH